MSGVPEGIDAIGRLMAMQLDLLSEVLGDDFVPTIVVRSTKSPRGHVFMSRDLPPAVITALNEMMSNEHRDCFATSEGVAEVPERKH